MKTPRVLTQGVCWCLILTTASAQPQFARPPRTGKGELTRGVIRGDKPMVRDLLRHGADPDEDLGTPGAPITPLFAAMALGDVEMATLLVSHADRLNLGTTYRGYTALDLASEWKQDTLIPRLGLERAAIPVANLDADGAVWVANGLAALSERRDLGTAMGLRYIVAAHEEAGPGGVNRELVLRQAMALRDGVGVLPASHPGAGRSLAAVAMVPMRVLTDRRLAQRVTLDLFAAHPRAPTRVSATSEDLPLDVTRTGFDEGHFREAALEAAYRLGKSTPEAGRTVDEFVGAAFNARLADRAATVARANTSRFHPAVLTLVERGDPPTREVIYKSWDEVFHDLRATNAASLETLRRIDRAEHDADRQFARHQTYTAIESSVYLLRTFAVVGGDAKLALQIAKAGGAGLQIGKAIEGFISTGSKTLASSVTLVGGIVGGIMMLASLFDSGPSPEQMILDQIAALRQQVEDLRFQMHERFDNLDRRLDQVVRLMVHGLHSLEVGQALARDELRGLTVQVSLLEAHLQGLEPSLRNYISTGADRGVWRDVFRSLDWEKQQQGRLSYDHVVLNLDTLRQAGTREAKDVLSKGRRLTDEELRDGSKLAALFLALSNDGLDPNIGLMQSVAGHFDPAGSFGRAPLANPMRWAVMTDLYSRLATQYPDYFLKRCTAAAVNELTSVGKEWREAIGSLKAGVGEGPSRATIYNRLLENYRAKADLFRLTVGERIKAFQIEHAEGYDIWGGAHQAPRPGSRRPAFGVAELPLSEDFDFAKVSPNLLAHWKGSRTLPAPGQLASPNAAQVLYNAALINAHHLGLGEIRARWTAPGWDEERRPWIKPGEDHIYGKAAVTVVVNFVTSDGKAYPMSNVRVNSGADFQFGIQTFKWRQKYEVKISLNNLRLDTLKEDLKNSTERTEPLWGHENMMIDPKNRVLLQEQILTHWGGMSARVFQGQSPAGVPPQTVTVASKLVEDHFQGLRNRLEKTLWAEVQGEDGRLVDAVRQITAAKAMLDAFVSLGMAHSLEEDSELRAVLSGNAWEKGRTRLLDGPAFEDAAARGVTLLEMARDSEWLDGPAKQLARRLQTISTTPEPHPLIEATLERLELLKLMHDSGHPKMALSMAARELTQAVRALAVQTEAKGVKQ
jgi:hypothetical protein